jgi:y4mF family transcriptional regulator
MGRGDTSDDRVRELAAAVRGRRRDLGLRQAELAALAGCSERFVHTVENGKASLRLDKLLDVLEVLGLDLSLVPGHGRVTASTAPEGTHG